MHFDWTRCYYCSAQIFNDELNKRCKVCQRDPKGPPPQVPLSSE
jgi:acetyl-CoA carboxylase beta subunit